MKKLPTVGGGTPHTLPPLGRIRSLGLDRFAPSQRLCPPQMFWLITPLPYSMYNIQETCQVTTPGDNYTVTVVSVSNGKNSAPNSITITSGVLIEYFEIFFKHLLPAWKFSLHHDRYNKYTQID